VTYHYAVAPTSKIYHLVKPDRIYSLCGLWVKTGKFLSSEPPAGKKECPQCAKIVREQAGNDPAHKPLTPRLFS
jgi:hypothetical protein